MTFHKKSKYIFTYWVYAFTKRVPSALVPCGGAFCPQGAREIIDSTKKDGFAIGKIVIAMYDYSNECLDYNKPLNSRTIRISAN